VSRHRVSRAASLRRGKQVAIHAFLLCGVCYVLVPLLWAASTSLKTQVEIYAYPPRWIPNSLYAGNYLETFSRTKMPRYIWNTLLVVVGTAVASLCLASHAAYAAVRYKFRGRDKLLILLWMTSMIPVVSLIVPLYLMSVKVGLYDTLVVLILVNSAWLVPTLVWLLKGFIQRIPYELEEAALIDGCGRLGCFYYVTLPLLRPGLAAGAVFVFANVWNDFLLVYALTISDGNRLVQVGLYSFLTEVGIQWGPLMAGTIGALVPVIILFILLQRSFVEGLTAGATVG
jgi:multiple sugar transport system permease protein